MADDVSPLATAQSITSDGLLLDCWYFAATSAELKAGKQFRRMIVGEPVLLGRTAKGEVLAIRDVCPHRAVPLSAGRQVETNGQATIECPYHGWRFGGDGVCKLMPSLVEGQPYDPAKVKVRRYPHAERNGLVFIYVSSDPRFDGTPDLPPPDFGIKADKPKFVVSRVFEAHMDNAVVGLMDPAHVPFVHNQWWWRPPSVGLKLKEKQFEPRLYGWAIARHAPSSNSLAYRLLFGEGVTTEIVFMVPGFRWEVVENDKSQFFTLTCLTPIDGKSTLITQISYWTRAPLLDLIKPILIPAAREFLDQDGRMVDLQNKGLPFTKGMLWIDDIDVQAKWYNKLKREWAQSRAEGRPFSNPIRPQSLKWRS
ncbi:aromatic ring-hydroxylating dioxygenase subunit alpha [Aquidulcibacter sp.]|uniref:aromatic ring-hydroxylating oxygenase subunit alpha n=1 Tax=Aquidulcibacter sp. TaxID=2052990 RepID=UPI0025BAF722|nr:aromatic ring-hydroxylating dioxygenase subunit alpha [Aquidulcibacter sp.]MCA3696010.1 aromatic ring-hydroxylating dioxygenase subunit alpha [Aquidulcibacter sp.]